MSAVPVDAELVRCLLMEQFPRWGRERIQPVIPGGWDNRTFRVGGQLLARLPSDESYLPAVEKEHTWLPLLAPRLPIPIPAPVALGHPGCGFQWRWSIYRWLPGEPAQPDRIDDLVQFARDLAGFLVALRRIDAAGGPAAGTHSFGRGGPLAVYDEETRTVAHSLRDIVDVPAVLDAWDAAMAVPYRDDPVWVHGDVTGSNLLVEDGRLAAVIDFGTCAIGDPACDLVIAWTLFESESRQAFREVLALDPSAWVRARGWALWKALLTVADQPGEQAALRRYGWRHRRALDLVHELVSDQSLV